MRRMYVGGALVGVILIALVIFGWWWLRPSRVVTAALENAGRAQTYHFDAELTLENDQTTKALLGEPGKIMLKMQGAFARFKEQQKPSLESAITAVIQTDSVSLQLTSEARFVGDKAYVLITKAPPVFPGLVRLRGTWLQLPRGGKAVPMASESKSQLFTEVHSRGQETIDGVSMTKYQAIASQAGIIQFMDSLATLLGTSLTETQVTQLRQSMAQVQSVGVELWVSPLRRQLHQFKASITVPGGNTMHIVLHLKDRNQPVEITVPANAKPVGQ